MNKETIIVHANVIRAFSGFIGVGAAIAYYFGRVRDDPLIFIVGSEVIYTLLTLIIFIIIHYSIKNGRTQNI